MEVTSIIYVVIAIISVFIYYVINKKFRIDFLVLISCGFIATYSHSLLLYVLLYSVFNFFITQKIQNSSYGKLLYRIGIFVNLTQLIVLRYASFAIDPVFQLFNSEIQISNISKIIIPIGISYFSLQGIGYLINVRMRWEKPETNFLHFLLYIIFAPKFISGPIERSNHFLPQLKEIKAFDSTNLTAGLRIALKGFFKKILIANHLATIVNEVYASPELYGGAYFWLLILLQPIYLYFDFSGYTDIAIGVARMFGINLLPNFNRPFLAENMTNFWKRFHISLSSWFNDYVFKQTSFKLRKWKKTSTVIALLITWILFGIWHGAGWNFMILGLVQAMAIIYEFYTKKLRTRVFAYLPDTLRLYLSRIFTYVFFGLALTFFFSPDFKTTQFVFSSLLQPFDLMRGKLIIGSLLSGVAFAGILLLLEIIREDFEDLYNKIESVWMKYKLLRISLYYLAGLLILSRLGGSGVFVYQMF